MRTGVIKKEKSYFNFRNSEAKQALLNENDSETSESPLFANRDSKASSSQLFAIGIEESKASDGQAINESISEEAQVSHRSPEISMCTRLRKSFSYIAPVLFSKEHSCKIVGGFILTGANVGLNLFTPYILGEIVDRLKSDSEESFVLCSIKIPLKGLVIIYGVSWTLSNLFSNLRTLVLTPISHKAFKKLAYQYTEYVFNQSLDYHENAGQGSHFFPIQNLYNAIPSISTQLFTQIAPTILEIGIAIAFLSSLYGPEIIALILGVFVLYTAFNVVSKNKVMDTRNEINIRGNELFDIVSDSLSNYKTVHMFSNVKYQLEKIEEKFNNLSDIAITSDKINAKTGIGQALILGIGFSATSIITANNISSRRYDAGDFVTIMSYFTTFVTPLSTFGTSISQFLSALTQLDVVFNALEKQSKIVDKFPHQKLNVERETANIEFRNINFRYTDGKSILSNISFTVKAGQKVGIVGSSGSGKSTLGKLLFRFCDATNGKILINDQDIRKVGLTSLRSAISIVPQETVLFNDSIYKNIEYGGLSLEEGVTAEEIDAVLKTVGLWEHFNSLPDKLDTKVGVGGAQVSGGQRQRIGIARALLKKPKILIFDEATSSLDNLTKVEVQQNIDKILEKEKITSIVITHDLFSIMNADNIFVLSEGQIVQQGNHNELLRDEESIYSKLWKKEYERNKELEWESKESTKSPMRTAGAADAK